MIQSFSPPQRSTAILIFCTLVAFLALSFMDTARADTCTGDCQNGTGTVVYSNGNRYTGSFRNGLPDGRGVQTTSSGQEYTGGFKNGNRDGFGILTVTGKFRYAGEFRQNTFDGAGILIMEDGTKYGGEFRSDKLSGIGFDIQPGGKSKYVGEWKDDSREGQGIKLWDGHTYMGKFKDDDFEGVGIFKLRGESASITVFKDGKLQSSRELDEPPRATVAPQVKPQPTYTPPAIDQSARDSEERRRRADEQAQMKANARNACLAQKQTCFAQCKGMSDRKESDSFFSTSPRFKCELSCSFIDCDK